MSATVDRPAARAATQTSDPPRALGRAEGLELLGEVSGSGYKEGARLARRADGQMVQLGPLMYGLLEEIDGRARSRRRSPPRCRSGSGARSGPSTSSRSARSSPGRACSPASRTRRRRARTRCSSLRWKVLFTDPKITQGDHAAVRALVPALGAAPGDGRVPRRLLVRPDPQGRRGGDRRGVREPRAAAARPRPDDRLGGLPRDRPRGGLPLRRRQARAAWAPASTSSGRPSTRTSPTPTGCRGAPACAPISAASTSTPSSRWSRSACGWRPGVEALLLLIAIQMLEIVKNLSPVIRADGYHILSDATGVPDLYAHMGPTLKRLLPWKRREPSALKGWARAVRDRVGADHRPDPARDGLQRDPAVPEARRLGVGERHRASSRRCPTRTSSACSPRSRACSRSPSRWRASR